MEKAPQLLIVSAPSGAGKDVILRRLLERYPELQKPVTTTTRPIRESDGEVDGVHYYFISEEEFRAGIERGDFLEYARVHERFFYGLSRASLARVREEGKFPVVILDVQGTASVRRMMPTLSVFIEAPAEELEKRIRAHRPADEAEERIRSISFELAQAPFYDVRIRNSNGRLDESVNELCQWYEEVARPCFQGRREQCRSSRGRER